MPDGKFGIGTSTPTEKFEVAGGNAKFGGEGIFGSIRIPAFANTTTEPTFMIADNTGLIAHLSLGQLVARTYKFVNCEDENEFGVLPNDISPSWNTKFHANALNPGTFDYHNILGTCSRVSIGERVGNLPSDIHNMPWLTVNGNSELNGDLKTTGNIDATSYSRQGTPVQFSQWANVTDGIKYSSGNVHIGARIPNGTHTDALLSVDGKIVATSCYVNTTSWADDVFSKNYTLTPLTEVENFYKQNKHLPEIPSEKEVIENGVNTAEMIKLLLKKVEELTLYTVQQQKEIEALKNTLK